MFAGRSHDAMEPLVFAILRALTPNDVQTTLIDERLEDIDFDRPTNLVAITVETFTSRRAYQIARQFRIRGIKVVLGGYHPTLLPEEALTHADAIVIGDAEGAWQKLLSDFIKGRLESVYQSPSFESITQSRYDRQIFAGKRYLPLTLVQYGRGCRFNCDFCSIRAFYGPNVRQRSLQSLVEDIASVSDRHVFFVDDNLYINAQNMRALLATLKPLKIGWSCQASIDLTYHPDLVRQMAECGCRSVLIGFESLSATSLGQMKKAWNQSHHDYAQAIHILRDHGIMIYGTFVIGYDHDTPDIFQRTLDFAINQKLYLANFNPLTPTPGTPLYKRLQTQGRLLLDRWWLDENYRYGQAIFRPAAMTPEQMQDGCYDIRTRFNSWSSISKRFCDRKANCRNLRNAAVYAVTNFVNRREIHAKQYQPLGAIESPTHQLSEGRDICV